MAWLSPEVFCGWRFAVLLTEPTALQWMRLSSWPSIKNTPPSHSCLHGGMYSLYIHAGCLYICVCLYMHVCSLLVVVRGSKVSQSTEFFKAQKCLFPDRQMITWKWSVLQPQSQMCWCPPCVSFPSICEQWLCSTLIETRVLINKHLVCNVMVWVLIVDAYFGIGIDCKELLQTAHCGPLLPTRHFL